MRADLVVVGAGPAGSTAARVAASLGLDVLLLDRARFPRDKPCGGAVSVRCARLLPFDISPVVEDVITGALVRLGDRKAVERTSEHALAYMTQRSKFDHFLVQRAEDAGAQFRDGQQVRRVTALPDGTYEVAVGDEVYRTRALVGADGANGVVARCLGFEDPPESAVALEANLPYPDGTPQWLRGRVALQFGRMAGGYGWLFPKGDHINVGVGGWKTVVGTQLRPSLDQLCRSYGIDPAALVSLRGHHLPMVRPGAPLTAGGAALVGDAAGLVDPLSGEGIYQAVASGKAAGAAAEAYLAGDTDSMAGYQRAVEEELMPDIVASHALTEIFHAFPPPFVTLLQRSGRFWDAMCGILRGEGSPQALSRSAGPFSASVGPVAALGRRITSRRYGRR